MKTLTFLKGGARSTPATLEPGDRVKVTCAETGDSRIIRSIVEA